MASQTPDFRKILSGLRKDTDYIVWWYGDIVLREGHQPQVDVLFREGISAKTVTPITINLTYLNFFPLGSVWENCRHIDDLDCLIEKYFVTSFDIGRYEQKLVSDVELLTKKPYQGTWGVLSNGSSVHLFQSTSSETLIIPSQLIFNCFYGFNAELRKRIVTSPIETLLRDCYEKIVPEPPDDGHWHIALPRIMRDLDIVQLASMKYDPFARNQVASVYASLQKVSPSKAKNFIHASPWWQGETSLKVYGLYLNKETFLVLRIAGASWPDDNIIDRIRYRTNKLGKGTKSDEFKLLKRNDIEKDVVEIADAASPDRDSPTTKLIDSTFCFLNEVEIRKIVSDQEGMPSKRGSEEEPEMFASGDGSGTGKGIGKLAIVTDLEIEKDKGALSGVWEELKERLGAKGDIRELYLSKADEQVKEADVEKLSVISFAPLEPGNYKLHKNWDGLTTDQRKRVKNWVYINKKQGELRGLLAIKLVTNNGSTIHILEIQRKVVGGKEESFRGLAFTLLDEQDFREELKRLMNIMSHNCGVISNDDLKQLKGYAYRYNHAKPRKEETRKKTRPYQAVVTRILKRLSRIDE